MNISIIIGLLQNTAILLALSMLYENFWINSNEPKKFFVKLISGLVISCIGLVLMYTPWTLVPGIVFDTRSVLISITGLFFGTIPTLIVMITTGLFRIGIGGDGQWMGVAVILSSGAIGLLWRYYRPNWRVKKKYYLELLAMGIIVHIIMSVCTLLLPVEKILPTFSTIALPLILIYSPATMLLGIIMLRQYKNRQSRQAQIKLVESERRLAKLFESGNIITVILNKDGVLTFCNEYFLKVTGYSKNEIYNKNWFDSFIPLEIKDKIFGIFQNGIQSGTIIRNYENEVVGKDGIVTYIYWHNIVLFSDNGEVTGVASIGVDTSERKKYESMLEEKNAEIESQNKELMQINDNLLIAKERAEESERLKLAFLANMSHEIRTPMNGILGFANLLKKTSLSVSDRLQYIGIIENSGNRLLNIINDILDLSKIESRTVKVHLSPVNINELIENIYLFFKPEIDAKNLGFSYSKGLTDFDANIQTDHEKVYAVLTNLVKNAIKFTTKGIIEFGYNVKEKNLEFFVKDTGIGISSEQKELIFERFRQGSESLSRDYEGAGLGLSISKAYIEMLGSEIKVDSKPNIGSCFSFVLHYNVNNENVIKEAQTVSNEEQIPKINILIAEDDETIEELLTINLKCYSKQLFVARNGLDVVKMVFENPDIDLILMDMRMPDISGYEATRRIREFNKNVFIIAQTAYAMNGDKEKALNTGCNDYISKPYKVDQILELMKKYFKINSV
ncbi:MAG: hypothetical protein CVU05_13555 [Bacteroidetes bacterium HGW-Bacteroidetes-21]|jgi:hypothetical protein|nr:MAG: hypothetical protein CVU05_13555 [Bacteroidetes bacterium HGW-Bacteroidetes-21]